MNNKTKITAAVTIAIILAGIVTYYLIPPSTPVAEVPPRIISDASYLSEDGKCYYVVGEVKNNLKTNIESVNVTATFYDAENNMIGTSSSRLYYVKTLEPEQKAPFIVYLLLKSPTNIPAGYELTLSYVKTSQETMLGLEIRNQISSVDRDGHYRISGEAHNTGRWKVFGVKIICTYYNPDGNVITISHTHVSSEIDTGDKAEFEISSKPNKLSPASYELLIVTHHHEPIFVANLVLLATLIAAFILFIAYMKRRGW